MAHFPSERFFGRTFFGAKRKKTVRARASRAPSFVSTRLGSRSTRASAADLHSRAFSHDHPFFSLRRAQEWTALQNLPSLPRDVTALGEEELAPSAPTPSRPARAAPRDFDFEHGDAGGAVTSSRSAAQVSAHRRGLAEAGADPTAAPEYLDLDAAALEEARRAATRATATATTLTIRAKEILDVVSSAETSAQRRVSSRARGAAKPRASLSRESSGVRTPTRSERGGLDSEPASADADADAGSPAVTRVRKRAREPVGAAARGDEGDSTDMEDSDAPAPAASARAGKRPKPSAVGAWAPKATDNIITADGQKVRRGCLHCGCQKTPQWRMGPTGPKTLCNACGVRFRKGMPMNE